MTDQIATAPQGQAQPASWWDDVLKALTSPKNYGPNFQAGMGMAAKAVNPIGITGNVGEMFSNYVQGVEAQKAASQQMLQNQEFLKNLLKLHGLLPKVQDEAKQQLGSQDWLGGLVNGGNMEWAPPPAKKETPVVPKYT